MKKKLSYKHYHEPFPHWIIEDFLPVIEAVDLIKALRKEKFFLKEADLFTFYQTNDLKSVKNKTLQEFNYYLCHEFAQELEKITKSKIKRDCIDISGNLYQNTNYLLPHDDRLEHRSFAFLYYLSDLEKKDGGVLALYDTKKISRAETPNKVAKRIIPKFNTMVIFQVSNKSFHEIEELLHDKQRLALSGWFHHAR